MSSAEIAASLLSKMNQHELRILQSIELGMAQYEYVPLEYMVKYSGLNDNEVLFWIRELDKKNLLLRQSESYIGFILNYNSYDLLALNALVKKEIINALGAPLGMGKEADVLSALTPTGIEVAIKLHRLGRTSFRDTRRKREFIAKKTRTSWLYQSRLAAEKEYAALSLTFNAGVSVPKPIFQNRHAIVMQKIEGNQLSEQISLSEPEVFLDEILSNIHIAYKAGVIHADLSEFNIILSNEGVVFIIDWPQYIQSNQKNADEILLRDVKNVLFFFKRKFNIGRNLESTLEFVKT